jgi:hypothetical protein
LFYSVLKDYPQRKNLSLPLGVNLKWKLGKDTLNASMIREWKRSIQSARKVKASGAGHGRGDE